MYRVRFLRVCPPYLSPWRVPCLASRWASPEGGGSCSRLDFANEFQPIQPAVCRRGGSWGLRITGKTHRAIERMLEHDTGMIGLPLRVVSAIESHRFPAVRSLIWRNAALDFSPPAAWRGGLSLPRPAPSPPPALPSATAGPRWSALSGSPERRFRFPPPPHSEAQQSRGVAGLFLCPRFRMCPQCAPSALLAGAAWSWGTGRSSCCTALARTSGDRCA